MTKIADHFNSLNNTFSIKEFVQNNGIEALNLQNRYETKYFFHPERILDLIDFLKVKFSLVSYGNQTIQRYRSEYFDTENFYFYKQHHNGQRPRLKVRFRHYLDSRISYFEIKEKDNRDKTSKFRKQVDFLYNTIDSQFIIDSPYSELSKKNFSKVLITEYQRVTLILKDSPVRITLDFGMKFKNFNNIEAETDIVVLELKYADKESVRIISEQLKNMKFYPKAFSKYCTGLVLTDNTLKHNSFKPLLRKLDKH